MKPKKLAKIAPAVAALVWLCWWWPHKPETNPTSLSISDVRVNEQTSTSATMLTNRTQPPLVSGFEVPQPRPVFAPPTVHEIRVAKQSVCRDEENFVEVRALGPDGTDDHLHITLEGHGADAEGSRMPFRLHSGRAEEMPHVRVEGRAGMQTVVPLPPIEVLDCEHAQRAEIKMHVLGFSVEDLRFRGVVAKGEFLAQRYEWDFGDGTHAVTDSAETTHSYRFRPQDKRFSSFVVTLTMLDGQGERLSASLSVGMPNHAFGRLVRHHQVALFSQHIAADDGERTRLYHAYRAPVQLERVAVKIVGEPGRAEQQVGTYAPTLIGLGQLQPREPGEVRLALHDLKLPTERPITLLFEVFGSTADGLPANGVFSTKLL